jgi:glycosyltransferase involved in cell wall biosynthesis
MAGLRRLGCDAELIYYNEVENAYDPVREFGVQPVFMPKRGRRLSFIRRLAQYFRERDFDVVHGFMDMPTVYAAVAGRLSDRQVVFGGIRVEYDGTGLVKLAHRLLNPGLAGWIVNSSASAKRLGEVFDIRPDRIHVVYNGLDVQRFEPRMSRDQAREKIGVNTSDSIVTIVARLEPQKNHRLFLDAAVELVRRKTRAKFLIVGDGSLGQLLRQDASERGLSDSVMFLGNRPNVEEILWATDVSVLTSDYEGLSNVLLESMASGVPVVSTDFAGVEELITHGESGFIVRRGDVSGMADRIESLLRNAEQRRQVGESGRRLVREGFSVEAMTRRLLDVYEEALSSRGGCHSSIVRNVRQG